MARSRRGPKRRRGGRPTAGAGSPAPGSTVSPLPTAGWARRLLSAPVLASASRPKGIAASRVLRAMALPSFVVAATLAGAHFFRPVPSQVKERPVDE
jgi:hypothetical protein